MLGAVTLAPFRRRGCLFVIAVCAIVPCMLFLLLMGPEFGTDQSLTQRVAEFQMRLQYLESMYRARQEDVTILSQYISLPSPNNDGTNLTISGPLLDALSPDTRSMLRNLSKSPKLPNSLRLPTAFHFLPHLLNDPSSLRPAFLMSRGRKSVTTVLGVPTVKRDKQSYLLSTLNNLITNMDESEQNETIIVVFVGETDVEYVQMIAHQIEEHFMPYVECGLIEVLSPPTSYYPDLDKLRITLNDTPERVKWRSKQNLDFAFLMTYAQPKATFYVQLEDDILAKRGFITVMKNFALEKTMLKNDWFVLDFCQLGFIGKMFKSSELPWLITFFQMFYNDKPVDWLLEHLIYTKVCNWERDAKHCKHEKSKLWLHYKPSLFQHIGTTSSLRGKVQKLKDKQFGKIPTFFPHKNPMAAVRTSITAYKTFTFARAYTGQTFFWGLIPQPGDTMEILFEEPYNLRKYLFRSGNSEHPSDRFYNTTVEVLPASLPENSIIWNTFNSTTDGYLIVGGFDEFGIADGTVDSKIGNVKEVRLRVHSETENWAILSEIHLQDKIS